MVRVHLDTDLGGDIDDLCALAMLLNWPGVELLAVTTVAEHRGQRAGYARYALHLAGREDVPVAAGADAALGCYRSWPGLPDEGAYWPEPVPPAAGSLDDALSLLAHSVEQGAQVIAIGPYTNLALLEERWPGILESAHLTLMGGYVHPPRPGFPQWRNEMDYNVQVDVRSAYTVLHSCHPTLVPISVTAETWLRQADLPALRRAGPLARLIAHQAEAFSKDEGYAARYGETCAGLPDDLVNFMHDPLACAIALGWRDGVEIEQTPLRFEMRDGWLWELVEEDGVPTQVVTGVDGARFSATWLDRVAGR